MRGPDKRLILIGNLERAKGFEPSTPTLARLCSTTELHPHPTSAARWRKRAAYGATRRAMQHPRDALARARVSRSTGANLQGRNAVNLGATDKVRPLVEAVRRMVRDEIMPLEGEYEAGVGAEGDRFKPTARMISIREGLKA